MPFPKKNTQLNTQHKSRLKSPTLSVDFWWLQLAFGGLRWLFASVGCWLLVASVGGFGCFWARVLAFCFCLLSVSFYLSFPLLFSFPFPFSLSLFLSFSIFFFPFSFNPFPLLVLFLFPFPFPYPFSFIRQQPGAQKKYIQTYPNYIRK